MKPFAPRPLEIVTLIAACFSTSVWAEQVAGLDSVIITSSSILPENLDLIPGSSEVINSQELEARKPFSVNEALREAAGVNVVGEDTFGLAPNIGVRGLNPRRSARTLLLEDGMPLFLAPYGDPSAHYSTPLERVDRIELLKGSGQILYGPQSVGGMINFVTKPVPNQFEGSVMLSAGTDSYTGAHVNLGTGGQWGGVMLDLIKKEGDGIRENHQFDVQEAVLKSKFKLSPTHSIMAKLGAYEERSNISETGLGTPEYAENPRQAPTGNNDNFKHDKLFIQLNHEAKLSKTATLNTQYYYIDANRTSLRQIEETDGDTGRSVLSRCPSGLPAEFNSNLSNANACGGRIRPRQYTVQGIEPRLDFSHKAFGIDSFATVGARYHEEDIERRQFRGRTLDNLQATFQEEILARVQATSLYAQNTFVMGNWSLTPGLRHESVDTDLNLSRLGGAAVNVPRSSSESELLPGLGVTWSGLKDTTLFAGVHRGFAPPRPDRDLGDANNAFRVSPEKSTNAELGLRSTAWTGVSFEATLFSIDFENLVVGPDADGRFTNAGEAVHRGFELASRFDIDQLFGLKRGLYASLAYTNTATAEFKTTFRSDDAEGEDGYGEFDAGNRLPYAPKHLINVGLGFEKQAGWSGRVGVSHVSEQFANSDNTRVESIDGYGGVVPSYTLVNAALSFKPAGAQHTYFVNAENLFDKEYLASRVNAKQLGRGQTVIAGVRFNF